MPERRGCPLVKGNSPQGFAWRRQGQTALAGRAFGGEGTPNYQQGRDWRHHRREARGRRE